MAARKKKGQKSTSKTSWDPLAAWYDGWVGQGGSQHHRELAIPAVMELLTPKPGENILDVGAGQGVLVPFIHDCGANYTGIEISEKLLSLAKSHHGDWGRFIKGDARYLSSMPQLQPEEFDAVVFLLSIQDMEPLDEIIESAAWTLKPLGRLVLLMTHPCFRIPRQSGWGWDEGRKLRFRRTDRYLTPLRVPLKVFPGKAEGVSHSFHRPLQDYINSLAKHGLYVDRLVEIPTYKVSTSGARAKAENLSNKEIPLFLGLRARKS